jgi:MOSC domain-containing protein YiiM
VLRIIAVNTGLPRDIIHRDRVVTTGIFKAPVSGRVIVRSTGLEGDGQADLTVHAGVDKAVYAYPSEHYDYWEHELGRQLVPGNFGENLTVSGLDESEVHVGDVFRVGTALCQVSQPRAPCYKLGIRMEMPTFPKIFLKSLRTGCYLRVLEEGMVSAGDAMELVERARDSMSVREVTHLAFLAKDDPERLHRASTIRALPQDWRDEFAKRAAGVQEAS